MGFANSRQDERSGSHRTLNLASGSCSIQKGRESTGGPDHEVVVWVKSEAFGGVKGNPIKRGTDMVHSALV